MWLHQQSCGVMWTTLWKEWILSKICRKNVICPKTEANSRNAVPEVLCSCLHACTIAHSNIHTSLLGVDETLFVFLCLRCWPLFIQQDSHLLLDQHPCHWKRWSYPVGYVHDSQHESGQCASEQQSQICTVANHTLAAWMPTSCLCSHGRPGRRHRAVQMGICKHHC